MRHPLHPALVHFPIVFWISACGLDVAFLYTQEAMLWQLSSGALIAGAAFGLAAMLVGLVDFTTISKQEEVVKIATRHLLVMATVWTIFVILLLLKISQPPGGVILYLYYGLSTTGIGLLLWGNWLGGRLVYEFGVGTISNKRLE